MVLELVAFDIETTGFGVDDEVTVIGFAVPMGVRVFVQTGSRDADGVERRVSDRVPVHVQVTTHPTERALFEAVGSFTADRLQDDDVLLVAFNGERWKGGFDLPFLRTRLARLEIEWPFRELPYADLLPVLTRRFNTTVTSCDGGDGDVVSDDQSDLAGVYDVLCDGRYSDVDPFVESGEAVTAFNEGRFADLVSHNVADVLRTRDLGRLAQWYCSKSEFSVKSLSPTVQR
ncbi:MULTISPECIES: hypothetical protein [Haloferacaceae]|uniref:Uncharacterized protein n=1 Tax=Halorubrum glutamatedens TaxID=2707018 RepID=A0ABD5QMS1_9EURY|nr:hypothetical protein [Halobellus captivus]